MPEGPSLPVEPNDGWFRTITERAGDTFYRVRVHPNIAVLFLSDTVYQHVGYTVEELRKNPFLLTSALDPKDAHQLTEEGYYGIYGKAGARMEMPGCSLCMGNQARVQTGSTVVSTSTRNFPNRLGDATNVYLASAELAAVASITGKLPTVEEYIESFHARSSLARARLGAAKAAA